MLHFRPAFICPQTHTHIHTPTLLPFICNLSFSCDFLTFPFSTFSTASSSNFAQSPIFIWFSCTIHWLIASVSRPRCAYTTTQIQTSFIRTFVYSCPSTQHSAFVCFFRLLIFTWFCPLYIAPFSPSHSSLLPLLGILCAAMSFDIRRPSAHARTSCNRVLCASCKICLRACVRFSRTACECVHILSNIVPGPSSCSSVPLPKPPSPCSYAIFALNKDHSPGYRMLITYFMDFAYFYFIALVCVVEHNSPTAALRSLTSSSTPAFTARSLIKPTNGPYVSIFYSPRCGAFFIFAVHLLHFEMVKAWLQYISSFHRNLCFNGRYVLWARVCVCCAAIDRVTNIRRYMASCLTTLCRRNMTNCGYVCTWVLIVHASALWLRSPMQLARGVGISYGAA